MGFNFDPGPKWRTVRKNNNTDKKKREKKKEKRRRKEQHRVSQLTLCSAEEGKGLCSELIQVGSWLPVQDFASSFNVASLCRIGLACVERIAT